MTRDGKEINRSLARMNFERALTLMPTKGTGGLKGRQDTSYTWSILMDPRIRQRDW